MDHDEFVKILLENNQLLVRHGQDMGTRISSSSTAVLLNPFPFKDSDETLTWLTYPTYSNIYTTDQYSEPGTMSTSEVSQPLSLSSVPTSRKTSLVLSKALLKKQDVTLVEPSLSCLRSGESASTWASVYGGSSSHLVNSTITEAGDPELKGKKKIRQQELDMDVKRTRAADMHNLSERRRRDRINQKIMALHELIPNSNKVDKASILDEAIEYLKTLQLQLQMMYIQSGLFNPLMMPPVEMQLPQMPTMSPFSPMDMGMGMGMGRGTGLSNGMEMYDSSNVHHFPVPSMQEQFAPGLMGMQASKDFPICGMLGQGLPIPLSMRPPSVLPTKVSSVTELSMPTTVLATSDVTLYSSSKNQQHHQSTDI